MIQEGVNAIVELAKSAGAKIIETNQEPPGVYYVRGGDGALTKVKAETAPRSHKVDSIETIVAFADRFADKASVWLAFEGVKVLVDDDVRNESAHLPLRPSKPMETLANYDNEGWKKYPLTQAEFILLLRTTFARAGATGGLLATIRSLRFRSAVEASGNIQHGKSSVGKAIDQAVTGEKDIPETVVFDIPVFESGFLSLQKVEVAIDINLAGERFYLIPLPGEVAGAKERACRQIEEFLISTIGEKGEVRNRIYRGLP